VAFARALTVPEGRANLKGVADALDYAHGHAKMVGGFRLPYTSTSATVDRYARLATTEHLTCPVSAATGLLYTNS